MFEKGVVSTPPAPLRLRGRPMFTSHRHGTGLLPRLQDRGPAGVEGADGAGVDPQGSAWGFQLEDVLQSRTEIWM